MLLIKYEKKNCVKAKIFQNKISPDGKKAIIGKDINGINFKYFYNFEKITI